MYPEKLEALGQELMEVETLPELKAMVCDMLATPECRCYAEDPQTVLWIKSTLQRLRWFAAVVEEVEEVAVQAPIQHEVIVRTGRKYKLLKTDVNWSTKPQVHAVMNILAAHLKIGDIIEEEQIVQMMVANENVLATRQGGKRIWDYYKGNNAEGLLAHGNVEKI